MSLLKYLEDNFLDETSLRLVTNEITEIYPEMVKFAGNGYSYSRVYLDEKYEDRTKSNILKIFSDKLFNNDFKNKMFNINDTAFRLFRSSTKHVTQLTECKNGDFFNWHEDIELLNIINPPIRLLNYMYYLPNFEFEGGELLISDVIDESNLVDANIETYTPKANRLIMIPSYYLHKVNKVKNCKKPRLTINGYIGFKT